MDFVMAHSNLDEFGGAERALMEIAKRMKPETIYTYNYEPTKTFEEFKGFNIVEIKKKVGKSALLQLNRGLAFYNYKIKEDYDVINAQWVPAHWLRNKNERVLWFCWAPSRAVYDLFRFRMKQYPLRFKLMHPFYSVWYKYMDRRIVPKIEKILVPSEVIKERVGRYFKRESEILYPGVDYKKFYLSDYKKYFFYPSRITPSKRFELALEAFNKFKKQGFTDWEFVIAGNTGKKDLWYRDKLKNMGAKILSNLSQPKLLKLYANCYSVIFTPVNEDFGLVPLEAQASYKPVLAMNEGGPRETIEDGKTGYLVNSVEKLAEKMKYLAKRPDVVEKMGKAGRKRVESKFNWNDFISVFKKRCKEVAKSS